MYLSHRYVPILVEHPVLTINADSRLEKIVSCYKKTVPLLMCVFIMCLSRI